MKNIKIEFKWAIIFTIMTLVWMLLEKTLGWHDEKIADHYWLTLLFIPIAIFMYLLALREKRRQIHIPAVCQVTLPFLQGTGFPAAGLRLR